MEQLKTKKCFFYIDDVIWVFRDLTRKKQISLFDNPFMAILKKAHEENGLKVQLNVFYRTDFYYGNDEFCLSEMTEAYKAEWEASSDWLKLGFHAKQEFPDYPYVNASYEDVKSNFDAIKNEILRFAGPKSFAYATVTHWLPMSKEGCQALRDGGIKIMTVSSGDKYPYNGDPFSLPYGHAGRLLQNKKTETAVFNRGTRDKAIDNSICGYNHLTDDIVDPMRFTLEAYLDKEIGIYFKKFCNSIFLNLCTLENIKEDLNAVLGHEYIGYVTHEQYFYEDYYAYQPDFAEKLYLASEILNKDGYVHFFMEETVK